MIKKGLLEYIVCPECKEGFRMIEHEDRPLEGLLLCTSGHVYPVFNGVPILIENNLLIDFLAKDEAKKFLTACEKSKIIFQKKHPSLDRYNVLLKKSYINWGMQWNIYKPENTVWNDRKTFIEHIPLEKNEIDSCNAILEIGCGSGRDIQHMSGRNKRVFGIDISDSTYDVHKKYLDKPDIFILRCDANHLPFKDSSFDLVYSDHVLHHINDLPGCFKEIARVSRKKSVFIFNLYGKENNFIMMGIIEPFKKIFLKNLPISIIHAISNLPAAALWLMIKLLYLPANRYLGGFYNRLPLSGHMVFWFSFDYHTLRGTCFDLLHAPIANYFGGDDIDELCRKTALALEKKYLLRETLWICKGRW